ncbi:LOG family protein [Planctomicrobium sp. SH661]|uniref:LOG family protein n=1 Tax=Planctomicrobium sp. SH661 TaxID=3448124 RepID=UPI003F5B8433
MPDANSPRANQQVSLADEEAVKEILVSTMFSLWDVVNNLSRLKPSKQDQYRVTIFGSARAKPGTSAYEEVKRIATALAEMGCDIITGGGPGLMQAANEGAAAANGDDDRSVGIRVDLPFEQHLNPFVLQAFQHRTFFTRLHQFVLMSDAYVVAPGGIGTLLEMTMIWQLLQVQHVRETPLILVGPMWKGLLHWAEDALLSTDPPLASAQDVKIPQCVQTGEEAIRLIRESHSRWLEKKQSSQ